jgi:hypothetical protein
MSIEQLNSASGHRSFMGRLQDAMEAHRDAATEDPWVLALRKLKGRTGSDGVERVSTNDVFDALEVPMKRRSSQTVKLSRLATGSKSF